MVGIVQTKRSNYIYKLKHACHDLRRDGSILRSTEILVGVLSIKQCDTLGLVSTVFQQTLCLLFFHPWSKDVKTHRMIVPPAHVKPKGPLFLLVFCIKKSEPVNKPRTAQCKSLTSTLGTT